MKEVIKAGYKVRGVVRSEEKAALLREVFHERYGSDCLEAVIVEDQSQPGALNAAMQGRYPPNYAIFFTLNILICNRLLWGHPYSQRHEIYS